MKYVDKEESLKLTYKLNNFKESKSIGTFITNFVKIENNKNIIGYENNKINNFIFSKKIIMKYV
jgi:hypothetical protein